MVSNPRPSRAGIRGVKRKRGPIAPAPDRDLNEGTRGGAWRDGKGLASAVLLEPLAPAPGFRISLIPGLGVVTRREIHEGPGVAVLECGEDLLDEFFHYPKA